MLDFKLDVDEAIALLNRAVQEKGEDYVYPETRCVYFMDEEPGCIIGHVLSYKGVSKSDLGFYNLSPVMHLDVAADGDTLFLLKEVQRLQDTHFKWGEAVEHAKRRLELMRNQWPIKT